MEGKVPGDIEGLWVGVMKKLSVRTDGVSGTNS